MQNLNVKSNKPSNGFLAILDEIKFINLEKFFFPEIFTRNRKLSVRTIYNKPRITRVDAACMAQNSHTMELTLMFEKMYFCIISGIKC